jgi:hypothetical protein
VTNVTKPPYDMVRRHFRRVDVPITVRPVSILARAVPRRVNDVSLGGLRAFSDERYVVGKRLELELAFQDGESATVLAEVVWIEALPTGSPALFDVGMRYVDASPEDMDRLQRALGPADQT